MCTAANLNHTRISFDRLKRLELLPNSLRCLHHSGDDLFLMPANVLGLVLLVDKLALERSLSKSPARRLTPHHLGVFEK
jgi:hypothetical protein